MARFLVTGASGFLGNAIARQLLAAGHAVSALCRGDNNPNLDDLPVNIVQADLSDPASLRHVADGCEGVFHVAADYRLWVPDPDRMYAANVEGSAALVDAAIAAGVTRIVYTSSVATLKVTADDAVSDEHDLGALTSMIGHYKRSKFLAEQRIRQKCDAGAPIVIVSPTAPVGPRDIKPTPTGQIIVDAANGKMPAFLDTGLNIAHVDDVARGHIQAYTQGQIGENYILGGDNLLLKDILALVAGMMGDRPPTVQLSPALIKPLAYLCEGFARLSGITPAIPLDGVRMAEKKMFFSHHKASAQLGYAPRPAGDAIADAIAWFYQQGYIRRAPRTATNHSQHNTTRETLSDR